MSRIIPAAVLTEMTWYGRERLGYTIRKEPITFQTRTGLTLTAQQHEDGGVYLTEKRSRALFTTPGAAIAFIMHLDSPAYFTHQRLSWNHTERQRTHGSAR